MLRGNHEMDAINYRYGFHSELMEKYGSQTLFKAFQIVFSYMPLSAVISGKILCMHGGLSEELLYARRLDILNNIRRPLRDEDVKEDTNPLAVNLLWADPDVNARPFGISRRGIGNVFGQEVIDRVLIRFDLDLIIRAHQVVLDGIEFFADNINSGLITVFSAPHYCGIYDNSGAVVRVGADLGVSFKIFKPQFPAPRLQLPRAVPDAAVREGKSKKER